jgi:hypothetical protein
LRFAPSHLFFAALLMMFPAPAGLGQNILGEAEEKIIQYESAQGCIDPVTLLQKRIADGHEKLIFEPRIGYLRSLLRALKVPVSSQGLVFSKTSSQKDHTSPKTPRAVYFSDSVYVGWVQDGPVIDIISVDPNRGPIFYTLAQKREAPQNFARSTECMQCHLGPKTIYVPGPLVRSIYTASNGAPLVEVDGFVNGHNAPLTDRWGGWYVTGTHTRSLSFLTPAGSFAKDAAEQSFSAPNDELHLGNIFVSDPNNPERLDLTTGANVRDLRGRFDTSPYLSPHSDIVALLVLEHQVRMQNLITHANFETRFALGAKALNGDGTQTPENSLGKGRRSGDSLTESQKLRIAMAGEMLLEYMLFRNEAPLVAPVKGTSNFAYEFQQGGPRHKDGRSLRQLDLTCRLFHFRCSYLIYSPAFDALPKEMKFYLWKRLEEILTGTDKGAIYASMISIERRDVLEILRETKPEFASWLQR